MPNFKPLASDLLAILLGVSIASSKESRRTSWFLTGVKEDFDMVVGVWGPPGCSMPNFKSLASDLLAILFGVSIASSKESRRTSWFLTGVKDDFDIRRHAWPCFGPERKPFLPIFRHNP